MIIAFTGPRTLTRTQEQTVRREIGELLQTATELHIGDAAGVDAIAYQLGQKTEVKLHYYQTEGYKPWKLQARSKRMVDSLATQRGTLYAYPNKPCPVGLTPSHCTSWKGSGTWGTVCYVVSKGVKLELRPLTEDAIADWLEVKQLSLL